MKAFGYEAGYAEVTYEWGVDVGEKCGGLNAETCDDGLECKNWSGGVTDPICECHTPTWCLSDETADVDCSNLVKVLGPGPSYWSCEEFECQFNTAHIYPGDQ